VKYIPTDAALPAKICGDGSFQPIDCAVGVLGRRRILAMKLRIILDICIYERGAVPRSQYQELLSGIHGANAKQGP